MALRCIEHYKASYHYHHKGLPFDIKHQLMLSDLLVVKIVLNTAIRISFNFLCYFCLYIPTTKEENLVKMGEN